MSRPISTDITELRARFRERVTAFARDEIVPRTDLREQQIVPSELLTAMGASGLAKIGIPEEYGGDGGDWRALALCAEAMTETAGNMGMVTIWMGRQLNAKLHILGLGTEEQKQTYLPAFAAGDLMSCVSISEPGAGAHPKHLKTAAVRDGDDYILNGEKAYLTNGPISDIFLILAITGEVNGRKQFSVFIVPKDSPGLEITEGIVIDWLQPASHCGLKLTNVCVPAQNMLGPEGDAFNEISLPMRRTEDALFAASKGGALRHIVTTLAKETGPQAFDDENLAELGRLASAASGLSAMSYRAADLLDADPAGNAAEISDIARAARDFCRGLQARLGILIGSLDVELTPAFAAEYRDFEKSLSVARSAHLLQARQRANSLF